MTCDEVTREHQRIERWQRGERHLRPMLRWAPIVYMASGTGAIVLGWWWLYWACVVMTAVVTVGDMVLQHYLERWRERFAVDFMAHMVGHAVDDEDAWIEQRLLAARERSKAHSLLN